MQDTVFLFFVFVVFKSINDFISKVYTKKWLFSKAAWTSIVQLLWRSPSVRKVRSKFKSNPEHDRGVPFGKKKHLMSHKPQFHRDKSHWLSLSKKVIGSIKDGISKVKESKVRKNLTCLRRRKGFDIKGRFIDI